VSCFRYECDLCGHLHTMSLSYCDSCGEYSTASGMLTTREVSRHIFNLQGECSVCGEKDYGKNHETDFL